MSLVSSLRPLAGDPERAAYWPPLGSTRSVAQGRGAPCTACGVYMKRSTVDLVGVLFAAACEDEASKPATAPTAPAAAPVAVQGSAAINGHPSDEDAGAQS